MKRMIGRIMFSFLGEKRFSKVVGFALRIKNPYEFEHFESFGDANQDKTIYLIRRKKGDGEGLLSVFTYVMGRIDYADRNGMIPFVDIDTNGKASMFNRYFVQKTEMSRDEVFKSKRVLMSGYDSKPVYPGWCNWINLNFNEQKRRLFDKYIGFTDEILRHVEKAALEIQPQSCLGLYLRGTDYISLKPGGHPIQPKLDDVAPEVERILADSGVNRIFLVTEDKQVYLECVERFGEKIVVLKDDFFLENYHQGELVMQSVARECSVEENNVLYLTKIVLLSQCHSFVGGRTNGSSVACALNGGNYKQKFVYDIGYYQ